MLRVTVFESKREDVAVLVLRQWSGQLDANVGNDGGVLWVRHIGWVPYSTVIALFIYPAHTHTTTSSVYPHVH